VYKFKIIDGENVSAISGRDGEIKKLEFEIQKKVDPTDRDFVVYAYHFVRLGNYLLAQKYLNKLDPGYFDTGVYRDLTHALLVWSLNSSMGGSMPPNSAAVYEYFVVIKRVLASFEDVNFQSKPAFYRFKKQFFEFTKVHGT
jgi:hypothetical protein